MLQFAEEVKQEALNQLGGEIESMEVIKVQSLGSEKNSNEDYVRASYNSAIEDVLSLINTKTVEDEMD